MKPLLSSTRFSLIRTLGEGGMGIVYEAFDNERRLHVALKTLKKLSPHNLYFFKNEFRSLADLNHPNLIRLYELIREEEDWFLSMELLRGQDFFSYASLTTLPPQEATQTVEEALQTSVGFPRQLSQPSTAPTSEETSSLPQRPHHFDEARLREGLRQLTEGLSALHSAGKIHRDIKPPNVFVTSEGRVVLMDFGLAHEQNSEDLKGRIVGTPAYMAPEQAAGRVVGPPADWYSVGALLYHCVTGVPPFLGPIAQILAEKQYQTPIPVQTRNPSVSESLASLCMALLSVDPASRPNEKDLLETFGSKTLLGPGASPRAEALSSERHFVGRLPERAQLREAFAESRAGRSVALLIEGESGVGKSATVKEFFKDLGLSSEQSQGEPKILMLWGRCYEREQVPFKAFDGLIDLLCRHLLPRDSASLASLLPQDVPLLARLFPVLRRIPRVRELSLEVAEPPDPFQVRSRAFGALRTLLARLACEAPLILVIDDLQWADPDSIALLAEVLRPPEAPPLLLVATRRPVLSKDPLDLLVELGVSLRRIVLRGLSMEESLSLLRSLGQPPSSSLLELAKEGEGHPLFLQELLRHQLQRRDDTREAQLDAAIWARVQLLEGAAQRLLALVVTAGAPIEQGLIEEALSLPPREFERIASLLRASQLIQTTGALRTDQIEVYHDRIREAVYTRLPKDTLKGHHLRLAETLEHRGAHEPHTLVRHLLAAGETRRAAHYAERAGRIAQEALAFDQAAALYRIALAHKGGAQEEQRPLQILLGDALSHAGRGSEAAKVFLEAARGAGTDLSLDLLRRAAEQLLRSGHLDGGLSLLRRVLTSVGLSYPETSAGALFSLLKNRTWLGIYGKRYVRREAHEVPPEELRRVDTCWTMVSGLAVSDFIRGADFQARHLRFALQSGEPFRVARALLVEGSFRALEEGYHQEQTLHFLQAGEAITEGLNHPYLRGSAALGRAISAFGAWRLRACCQAYDQAMEIFQSQCGGNIAWEVAMQRHFLTYALYWMGDLSELSKRATLYLKEAQSLGDLFAATNLKTFALPLLKLAANQPQEAKQMAQEALRRWSSSGFFVQHWHELFVHTMALLYQREPLAARALLRERWGALQRSLLLRVSVLSIPTLFLRGCCSLASAAVSYDTESFLREALHDAQKLSKEAPPVARAFSLLLQAGVARLQREKGRASSLYSEAIRIFSFCEMRLFVQAASYRKSQATGATEDTLSQPPEIKDPERFFSILAP